MKIQIVAGGNYSRPLPEALARALKKEIWNHLAGYGLTDLKVGVSEEDQDDQTDSPR
jgi:hypothetical protein